MKEFVIELWGEGFPGRIMLFMCAVILISLFAFPFGLYALKEAAEEFNLWASEHCKIVGKIESSVSIGTGTSIMYNGKLGTITTTNIEPEKTGYQCDDGITYWR